MYIRPYINDDWPRVCEIHDAARRDELSATDLNEAFLKLVETAENEGFHDYELLVAEVGGNVCGFVAFSEVELSWLYVDPAFYGNGIGSALVHEALRTTRVSLSVEVLDGNDAAISLYKKAGFVEVGRTSGCMPGNEKFVVSVIELRHPGVT